jgi:RNA-binding protein
MIHDANGNLYYIHCTISPIIDVNPEYLMSLNRKQTSYLRGLAHSLPAVISIGGSGLSEPVMAELESTLAHHELIKIKISTDNREMRKKFVQEICSKTSAELVQQIGKVAIIYKQGEERKIKLPS